jgi:hypothetical protein
MSGFISRFWEKVDKCDHKNMSPDYLGGVYCDTPYCGGWEERCLDCGVYITKCGCGCNNGMSGWPEKRWRKQYATS